MIVFVTSLSVSATNWMDSTSYANKNHYNYNLSILILDNVTYFYDKVSSSTADTSWIIKLMDRSQQVMTIVGLIANILTSITLIKNGQVSVTSNNNGIY